MQQGFTFYSALQTTSRTIYIPLAPKRKKKENKMVLEQLYSAEFLREKPYYGILLGLSYTVFGIALAMFLFPKDPALVAVAITAIFLLPTLYQVTQTEEQENATTDFSAQKLWQENKKTTYLYLAIFFGSFFAFALFSLMLPKLAGNMLFKQQLQIMYGIGHATFSNQLFWELLVNNFKVLLLCFLLAIVAGNGSIFLIIWNASVWGTIFGRLALTVGAKIAGSPVIIFVLIMLSVLPHVFLEMISYILAVMSGSLISSGFAKEDVKGQRMQSVLMYNIALLGAALAVLVIAAAVETFVLNNFDTYAKIAELAFE